MESSSLAVVLALTLACTGGMFLVIAKQMRGRSGLATFALGLALFGLAEAVHTLGHAGAVTPAATGSFYDVMLMLSALLLGPALLSMHAAQLSRQLDKSGPDEALRGHFARRYLEPMAERLRASVAAIQTGLTEGGGHLRVTVSVGLSRPFADIDQWRGAWSEAELSLQAAKDAGSNCVVHPTSA